jgi:hypothetical protein
MNAREGAAASRGEVSVEELRERAEKLFQRVQQLKEHL